MLSLLARLSIIGLLLSLIGQKCVVVQRKLKNYGSRLDYNFSTSALQDIQSLRKGSALVSFFCCCCGNTETWQLDSNTWKLDMTLIFISE